MNSLTHSLTWQYNLTPISQFYPKCRIKYSTLKILSPERLQDSDPFHNYVTVTKPGFTWTVHHLQLWLYLEVLSGLLKDTIVKTLDLLSNTPMVQFLVLLMVYLLLYSILKKWSPNDSITSPTKNLPCTPIVHYFNNFTIEE